MAGTDNTNSTRSYYAWADVANNVRMSGITTTTEASSSSSSAEAKQTGFDFTEIFNQLSALSQDISKKIVAEEEANKRMASLGSSVGKRVVLKGEMRMSPLMAKKLNAEVKVGSEEDGFRITHASSSSPSFSHRGGGGGGGDISLRQVAFKNNNRRPPPCTTNTDNTFTTRGSGVVGSPTPLNFEEVGVIADAKKTTSLFRDPAKGEEQQEENENVGV